MASDTDPQTYALAGDDGDRDRRSVDGGPESDDSSRDVTEVSVLEQARALFEAALATFQSSLDLFKAEFRLAKRSASTLLMMAAIAVVLAISAWLALLALIAAGVYELTGNWFFGIGTVVVLTAAGIVWVVVVIKRCLRDVAMPRTRRMLSGQSAASAPEAQQ